ncbi:MAG: GDSL-type esterase/lipase family protein [Actinomycetota bacterium]
MRRSVCVLALAALLGGGCTGKGAPLDRIVATPTKIPGVAVVYAALGASETAGVGTFDPLRNAWPRVLWRGTLPSGSTLFDLGVPGTLASQALVDQVPQAVELQPDLATVWLNVNDLIRGVPAAAYGRTLGRIVHALRGDGRTTVLVANTPHVELLPAYFACRSINGLYTAPRGNVVQCPPELLGALPAPARVERMVDAYNEVISRVVRTEGALLVDLHGLGPVPTDHPEYIADDGFHPSNEGAAEVATLFGEAWTQSRPG